MEDELWLKKIKDKLEDYSEPLPVAGWERLEKELSVSGATAKAGTDVCRISFPTGLCNSHRLTDETATSNTAAAAPAQRRKGIILCGPVIVAPGTDNYFSTRPHPATGIGSE